MLNYDVKEMTMLNACYKACKHPRYKPAAHKSLGNQMHAWTKAYL